MSWDFLTWLLAFVIQAALLGMVMYALICLSDLENDFSNPHDTAASVNRWVIPEYLAQAAITLLLLGTGKWLAGAAQAVVAAYHARLWMRRATHCDVTEIFKQLPAQKRQRMVKLGIYLVLFVLTIYRLIETAIAALLHGQPAHEHAGWNDWHAA